jgi:hypothetical protein
MPVHRLARWLFAASVDWQATIFSNGFQTGWPSPMDWMGWFSLAVTGEVIAGIGVAGNFLAWR